MKRIFWLGWLGLLLFEVLNVYFIMPMPGSQQMNSVDAAYFLYRWRWLFRSLFLLMIVVGLFRSKWKRKWVLVLPLGLLAAVVYMTNFVMAADHMFYQPKQLRMVAAADNRVDSQRLVLGVVNNGQARAYPIRFLGYHHQVQDTVGGKPLIITYCTVCRTGRVFEPVVDGQPEQFRLVGMDHFNAMFEDRRTKSWWRQVNGEAITGKLRGHQLPEFFSVQISLGQWLRMNPNSLVMQADSNFITSYDTTLKYESGLSRKKLTGTDSLSWKDKSWVVGLKSGNDRKAYDWNQLKKVRIIHDTIGSNPVLIVISQDDKGFFAFRRPDASSRFTVDKDTLLMNGHRFWLNGEGIDTAYALTPLPATQEFWHSWRTFNPGTRRYAPAGQ